ncbi:MAG TPA: dTMP kinase, partial [Fibrobacteria bacterium]|nr:dTMP kinase [Fibrobacteria bacterium]
MGAQGGIPAPGPGSGPGLPDPGNAQDTSAEPGIPAGHPRFFSLEGVDGSGKTTQLALLAEAVRAAGFEPLCLREPGGTPVSDRIREVLLAPGHVVAPAAELLLFSAARAQLVSQVIA